MRYNYLKRRLDVLSPLLEERLRKYVKQGKAEIVQDNNVALEVDFTNVTDRLGNPKCCKVLYEKDVDGLTIFT